MKLKPIATIRLKLLANKAAPSPILGQALGPYGINIMEFCKTFNNQTKNIKDTVLIPMTLTIFNHNSFEISIKTPTTTFLLKNIVGFTKGSSLPKKNNLNTFVLLKEIYHIALFKKSNRLMNHLSLQSICKTIIGSIKSMGLPIK
jgi:large subunit ribosomal protein L11